jgi:F0F1-type ATP synthase assembly protein I
MKKRLKSKDKINIWVSLPISIDIIVSILIWAFTNKENAGSFFMGGLIAIFPQAVFGFFSFKHYGAQRSKQIWQGFIRGEAIKFTLIALLFMFAYKFLLVKTLWLLLAFIMMQFIGLIINCKLLDR